MKIFLYVFFFLFFLSVLVLCGMFLLCFFVSFKDFFYFKLSSYECGFTPFSKLGLGYNLLFFSVILMFVVFELEVVVFIFLVFSDVFGLLSFFLFVFYMGFSFYMEWFFNKLVWYI